MKLQSSKVKKLALLAIAGAAALMLVTGGPAAGDSATAAKGKRVSIKDDLFSPKTIQVGVGGKVTWVWKGSNSHNVTFRKVPRGGGKRSSTTKSSGRFARTFKKRGTYRYVCTIHQSIGMKGTVKAG
jgi:plastocyanin